MPVELILSVIGHGQKTAIENDETKTIQTPGFSEWCGSRARGCKLFGQMPSCHYGSLAGLDRSASGRTTNQTLHTYLRKTLWPLGIIGRYVGLLDFVDIHLQAGSRGGGGGL